MTSSGCDSAPWKPPVEVDQPRRIGAVVAVDGLVIVTDTEDRTAGRREQTDQHQVRGREILELVDEEGAAGRLRDPARVGLCQQDLDRPVDLVIEVDRTLPVECCSILRPHLGQTVDIAAIPSLGVHRCDEAQTNEAERIDPRRERIDVELARCLHEPAQQSPHVGLVDRAPSPSLGRERSRTVDDRRRDRVQGADVEAREIGRTFTHLLLCPLVERNERQRRRWEVPTSQQMAGSFGQYPGLAGTGRSNDARHPCWMGDGRQLVRRQRRFAAVRRGRKESAVLDLYGVHHVDAVDRRGETDGPTVEPRHASVGRRDVAVVGASRRTSRQGTVDDGPPPDVAVPGIDRVRPDQMVQFVVLECVLHPQNEWLSVGCRRRLPIEVDGERDDDANAAPGRPSQRLDRLRRGIDGRAIDLDPFAPDPVVGYGLPCGNDDIPSEDRRSAPGRDIGHHLIRGVVAALAGIVLVRS